MSRCASKARDLGELFRLDAKAQGDTVVVGGWRCAGGISTRDASWFSVRLTRRNAPWAFARGEPFRTIASLELMGALLGVMILLPAEGFARCFDASRGRLRSPSRVTLPPLASSARANAPCQGPISKDPPGARRTCAFARRVVGGVPGATGNDVVASSESVATFTFFLFVVGPTSRGGHACATPSIRGPWRCAKRAGKPPGTVSAPSASGTSTLLPKTLRVVIVLCRGGRRDVVT